MPKIKVEVEVPNYCREYDHNINITVSDVIDDIICIAKNMALIWR